jgi:Rieske Fe-S protein
MTQDVSTPGTGGSLTRRAVPAAVVVVGAAAGVGAAWSHRDGAGRGANASGPAAAGGGGGTQLAAVSQIPDDGGLILEKDNVVLVKDASGGVKGFSAVCTHQGCTVSDISGGTINCPCHGSKFDAKTGAVVQGPASAPLAPVQVSVRGDAVFTG